MSKEAYISLIITDFKKQISNFKLKALILHFCSHLYVMSIQQKVLALFPSRPSPETRVLFILKISTPAPQSIHH